MTHQTPSGRRAASALLPVGTAALATGIFIAEAITPTKLAVAICYVVVVLLAAVSVAREASHWSVPGA